MKSSFALAALLCAPEVFAVALPHIPKLKSRRYHKDEVDSTNNAAHAERANVHDHGNELKPRRGVPLEVAGPSSTPVVTTVAENGVSGPSATPISSHLGMLPRPAATLHNPYIGNHPFIGHGPVIRLPTATPSASGYGENFTLTYLATGTTPPIANATATIYVPPIVYPIDNTTVNSTSCDAVPELIDDNGNFLPGDLQPKYNGSSHCSPSAVIPTYEIPEPEAERIVIEGHMQGENEIVEVEITPLPVNISSWNNTADNNYGTYYGANPTGYAYPSAVPTISYSPNYLSSIATLASSAPAASSSAPVHRVPTSSTPGFTGPKVRRALVHSDLDDEGLAALTDLDFD